MFARLSGPPEPEAQLVGLQRIAHFRPLSSDPTQVLLEQDLGGKGANDGR